MNKRKFERNCRIYIDKKIWNIDYSYVSLEWVK